LSFTLVSFGACQPVNKAKKELSIKDQIKILASRYHEEGKFDGTILVADSNGVIFKGAFGLANREKDIPLFIE